MKQIKTLYSALGRSERSALRAYLGLFGKGAAGNIPLQFLKMLDKNIHISQEKAAEKLYGDPRSKAFSMMKKRLYERMTEFLTLSLNPGLGDFDKETPYFHDLIAFRKNMLIATVLQEMRIGSLVTDHFDEARALARSCQNPELEADVLLRIRGTLQLQKLPFEEISHELHVALEATERDAHVIGVYHDFLRRFNLSSSQQTEKLDFLDEHLPNLELRLQQFYSVRADYYLQLMKIHQHRIRRDFGAGKAAAFKAQALLEAHPGLRSRQRMAEPSYQLGMLALQAEEFKEAIDSIQGARQYLKPQSQSEFLLSTILLYPLIYEGRFAEARAEGTRIADLAAQESFAGHQRIQELADYLLACVAYLEGNVRGARRRLHTLEALGKDKAGWALGLRIFEVVFLVDGGALEEAEQRVESLRKHLERHTVSDREAALVRLLRNQSRQFFSFKPLESETAALAELEGLPWDPVGHEVVRVDDWYRSHMRKAAARTAQASKSTQ